VATDDVSKLDVPPAIKFQFVGGDLCLDFCNTVGGKRSATTREKLKSYADFVSWCEQAGLIANSAATTLLQRAARQPREAASVLERAIELREAIYRIFSALGLKKEADESDLARLNSELARAPGRLRLAASKDGFAWEWSNDGRALDQSLGPIARAAGDLLTHGETVKHVSECAAENCGWLFVDSSKNHSRRWCEMRDCGNRAKVRRHRLKQAKS